MKRFICLVSSAAIAVALTACGSSRHTTTAVVVTNGPAASPAPAKHGPPPHAPAHGYRYKHDGDGVDLVYDSGLRVYVVAHTNNRYFYDGHYYCRRGSRWVAADRLSGPWTVTVAKDFPLASTKGEKSMKAEKGEKGKKKGKGARVN